MSWTRQRKANAPQRNKNGLDQRRQILQVRVGLQQRKNAGVGRRIAKARNRA